MINDRLPIVLVVEDNEPDIDLMKFFFSNCGVETSLNFVTDGMMASDFLFKRNEFAESPTPDVVLLDLNLPRKNGREVLSELKKSRDLSKIPVIVVSTSTNRREIAEIYTAGANAFISKSPSLDVFQETINSLVDFWFKRTSLGTELS